MKRKFNVFSRQFLILESILVGILAGGIGVAFRISLSYGERLRSHFLAWAQHASVMGILLWLATIGLTGLIGALAIKWIPYASGSGIPQVKAILYNLLRVNWWKTILAKFAGGLVVLAGGFSLGREGPTVQLGAAMAQGISRLIHRSKTEERCLITAGAAAGLAAAFNAPLAAVIFGLEELQRNFSPYIISSTLIASVCADWIARNFTGGEPVFEVRGLNIIPLRYFLLLIGIGILGGLTGCLFNRLIEKSHDLTVKFHISKMALSVIIALFVGIIGFVFPMTLGGGNELIMKIAHGEILLSIIPLLFLLKFVLTVSGYETGVPGGIFLPMLVLGALIGSFYGQVLARLLPGLNLYANTFVILGMAAIFASIVRAPVTGTVLIVEMTGTFEHLFPLLAASMVAYLVTEQERVEPIYEMLMHRLLHKGPGQGYSSNRKTLIEITVEAGSPVENKMIKKVGLPEGILLTGIRRGNEEIIPRGNTLFYSGDIITALVPDKEKEAKVLELGKLTKCQIDPF
jgi:CIC family chloride channel protein